MSSPAERIIGHVPAGDPKHPIPFPFDRLTDDEFDELVYLLAHADDPRVLKLRAPDGGLDTVRPLEADPTVAEWGIQAKLHRQHIKWGDCRDSLDRAVAVWNAKTVTFAFPRDLTQGQHSLFHKHLTGRHPGVTVAWWGTSKLTALLLATPARRGIAKRFFHTEDLADLADRAIRAGGPLRTASDLLERETVATGFLRSADPHFDYAVYKGPRTSTPIPRTPDAMLRLEFGKDQEQLVVDAVPRAVPVPPQAVPRGVLSFPDAAGSQRAQDLLRAVGTKGGRADLGPVSFRFEHVPAPFDELLTQPIQGMVRVRAEREVPLWLATVFVETDQGTATVDFDLAAQDPGDDWDARIVGRRNGLTLELRFVWSHSEQRGMLQLHWHLTRATGSASDRAEILGFLIALHGTGRFEVRDREGRRKPLAESTVAASVPDDFRHLQRIYADLATIQEFAGATFGPTPEEFSSEDAANLAFLANALHEGGYDATLHSGRMRCGPEALKSFRRSGSNIEIHETLVGNFFGHELPVAKRIMKLPLMVIKHAIRIPGAEPLWDVEIVPATGDRAEVRCLLVRLDPQPDQRAA